MAERELSDVGKGVNYAAGCFLFCAFAVCAVAVIFFVFAMIGSAGQ